MAGIGWIDSEAFDEHRNHAAHPERVERLVVVRDALAGSSLDLDRREPTAAVREQLLAVHDGHWIDSLEELCSAGGGSIDADTSAVRESWRAALEAAGAVVDAVDRVLDGEWRRAFCSVRPPGHHARPGTGMGFCLFNNVAVAAEAAIASGRVERVAILDWDVHHGNGTQEIFWRRPDVLFASWHQFPFYPGSGAADETGEGEGDGTTVNCPLPTGAGDTELLASWRDRVRPALERFEPQLVLVSAGFDADRRDPLAQLEVSPDGYEQLSAAVVAFAEEACDGRLVSTLEGGYNLDALAEDVAVHATTLF